MPKRPFTAVKCSPRATYPLRAVLTPLNSLYFSLLAGNLAENSSRQTPSSATQSLRIVLCTVFHGKVDLTAYNAGILQTSHTPNSLYRRNRGSLAPIFSEVR